LLYCDVDVHESRRETRHAMTTRKLIDLAQRYLVNDLPGSTIPASRLSGILEKIQAGQPITTNGHSYLQQLGLTALGQFLRGEITFESFQDLAASEQVQREHSAEVERQAQHVAMLANEAEQKAREAEYWAQREAARRAQESDPKYIAKVKNQALRARFGVDLFIEQEHFSRLMNMLHRLDGGNRLTDDDVLWLTTEGRNYFSESLRTAFHAREAAFFVDEYLRTSDPWNAVNASGHFRKCAEARKAHDLLTSIPPDRQKVPKLRSAIATTHGGVMRDLNRLDEALKLGNQAHAFTPRDFRPCTLLGAVNFELGHFDTARDWYAKAIERGATERSIDFDLRGIFLRADPVRREKIRAFLLGENPDRYSWVNQGASKLVSKESRTGKKI
jgi:tetratricopeptide (TPR) repeat protein